MKLSLLVLTPGKMQGKTLDITASQFIIGRDPQCHLRPASPLISKRHCAILQREGKVFIRDFESTNGTLVNDEPIEGERELHNDDQLKIGPLLFAVRLEVAAPAPRMVAGKTPPPASGAPTKLTPTPATATPPPVSATGPAKAVATTGNSGGQPAKPAGKGSASEDDLVAMLMSMGDDDNVNSSGDPVIPDGSTVHELKVPEDVAAKLNEAGKEDKSKKSSHSANTANTSAAAASILQKLTRRPRT